MRAVCPFCILRKGTPDKRWSWGHHPESGKWHCFRCGAWGTFGEGRGGKDYKPPKIDDVLPPEALLDCERMPETFALLRDHEADEDDVWGSVTDPFAPVRDFLSRRGVAPETIERVGIGAVLNGCQRQDPSCTNGDPCLSCRFRKRVIVPIRDATDDHLIGYVGRLWKNGWLNYLYPPGMPRGQALFNHAAVHVETSTPLLVVEGVFDALPYWPHAVACLGKPTEDQIESIAQAARPVVMALDGDAWRESRAWAMLLARYKHPHPNFRVGFVKLPPTEDPNSVDPSWLLEQAKQCVA